MDTTTTKENEMPRGMLTLAQAAERLSLSPATLRSQVTKGRLRAEMVGKTWIVSAWEVERYRAQSLGKIGRPPKEGTSND